MPTDTRKRLSPPQPVAIRPDIIKLLAELPDARTGAPPIAWTPELDAALLKFWPVKRKKDVAQILGRSVNVCRDRYQELIAGG